MGKSDWLTIELTRLRFPAACCACAAPTQSRVEYPAGQRFWWLARFLGLALYVMIPIPTCDACIDALRRRRRIGAGVGVLLGAGACAALGFAATGEAVTGAIAGSIVGALLGFVIGDNMRPAVWLKDYRPLRRTVSLRFRAPEYAQAVAALQEERRA